MSAALRSALGAAVTGVVALLVVLAATSTPAGKAVDVFLLYLGGVTLLALVAETSAAAGGDSDSEFDAALAPSRRRSERPRELSQLEREVHLGEASAFYLHFRLRTTLRAVASHRLSAHKGIDLERDPDAARVALGEQAWELLRADREPPRHRDARGMAVEDLRAVVDAVENV